MSDLRWTADEPTTPGHYWVRWRLAGGGWHVGITRVTAAEPDWMEGGYAGREWAGPIEPPPAGPESFGPRFSQRHVM